MRKNGKENLLRRCTPYKSLKLGPVGSGNMKVIMWYSITLNWYSGGYSKEFANLSLVVKSF